MNKLRQALRQTTSDGATSPSGRVLRSCMKAIRNLRNVFATVNEKATYVVGHPRSGTTAIAQLLGDLAGVRVAQETGWATRDAKDLYSGKMALEAFLSRYSLEFSRPIVQTPGLTILLPQLRERFPMVKMVYIVRDPRDVVCSVIAMSNKADSDDFVIDDPDFILFDNRWLGIQESDPVRSVAHRWRLCLEIAGRCDGVAYYRYEGFCEDKVAFIEGLARDLNLPRRRDIRDEVAVQFRGRGQIHGPNRWTRMLPPEAVEDVERICADGMKRFGYELSAFR